MFDISLGGSMRVKWITATLLAAPIAFAALPGTANADATVQQRPQAGSCSSGGIVGGALGGVAIGVGGLIDQVFLGGALQKAAQDFVKNLGSLTPDQVKCLVEKSGCVKAGAIGSVANGLAQIAGGLDSGLIGGKGQEVVKTLSDMGLAPEEVQCLAKAGSKIDKE